MLLAWILSVALVMAPAGEVTDDGIKYIADYSALAVSEMQRTGVPASITLAQGMLESRYGRSELALMSNNHFGIKCHSDWKGRSVRYDDDRAKECFRVYDKVEQSFADHSDFLRGRSNYQALFKLKTTDYKGWARGLSKAGYATDPKYAAKLIDLIERYSLYRFDTPVEVAAPEVLIADKPKSKPVEPKPVAAWNEEETFSIERTVYVKDKAEFIYSVEGETYEGIAREYGLFLREILRYNSLKAPQPLEPGTIVYLTKPRRAK